MNNQNGPRHSRNAENKCESCSRPLSVSILKVLHLVAAWERNNWSHETMCFCDGNCSVNYAPNNGFRRTSRRLGCRQVRIGAIYLLFLNWTSRLTIRILKFDANIEAAALQGRIHHLRTSSRLDAHRVEKLDCNDGNQAETSYWHSRLFASVIIICFWP